MPIRDNVLPDEVKSSASMDMTVASARNLSLQARATRDTEDSAFPNVLSMLVRAGQLLPAWWSPSRDIELSRFWKQSDHLSGAVYALTGKIATMRWRIVPADRTINSQVRMAAEATEILLNTPEWGAGWQTFVEKWVQALLTMDNGTFAEIIGPGPKDGPRFGRPVSIAFLDPARAQRTSNPEYPVIYHDQDGQRYKLHYTRVMLDSQMPSTDIEMNGVGFSAVSRAVNTGQNLIDIGVYKQEKLGSRPPRMMVIGRKGVTTRELLSAFGRSEEYDDNAGLSRYRRIVAIAPKQGRGEVDIDVQDLASVPDGFNERDSTELGMYAIALAFGVDARELWPSTVSGSTKGDAMVQNLKARGKGPGRIMASIERQINQKFLPPSLRFQFDLVDDEQDALQADVKDSRSIRHERDVESEIISIRVAREQMLDDGDLTRSQFEQLELEDGRLPDGLSTLTLFFSSDPDFKDLLSVNIDKPLDFGNNTNDVLRERATLAIMDSIMRVKEALVNASGGNQRRKARWALAALNELHEKWEEGKEELEQVEPERPGPKPTQTRADAERNRNASDYRGESESQVVENL